MTSTRIQKYNSAFTNESSYKFAFYLNVKKKKLNGNYSNYYIVLWGDKIHF